MNERKKDGRSYTKERKKERKNIEAVKSKERKKDRRSYTKERKKERK